MSKWGYAPTRRENKKTKNKKMGNKKTKKRKMGKKENE